MRTPATAELWRSTPPSVLTLTDPTSRGSIQSTFHRSLGQTRHSEEPFGGTGQHILRDKKSRIQIVQSGLRLETMFVATKPHGPTPKREDDGPRDTQRMGKRGFAMRFKPKMKRNGMYTTTY